MNERSHLEASVITTALALPSSGLSERSEFPRLAVISSAGVIGNESLAKVNHLQAAMWAIT